MITCCQDCQKRNWNKHQVWGNILKGQYSVTVELLDHRIGAQLKEKEAGPKPNPKSKKKFIVKIQTRKQNTHPRQNLFLYGKSVSINGYIHSPEVFHVIIECGVVGQTTNFTGKKAYFYATFATPSDRKKLIIYLNELAPYQDW